MIETYDPGRPNPNEYLGYFEAYISLVGNGNILEILESQIKYIQTILNPISVEQSERLHEPYTWTIKQVVGHCVDTERIFGYRACRFAAADGTSLPGFDQDMFVDNTDYTEISLDELIDELINLRRGNLNLFRRQTPDSWLRQGSGDGKIMTVRAVAYILAGHVMHHFQIIENRISGG